MNQTVKQLRNNWIRKKSGQKRLLIKRLIRRGTKYDSVKAESEVEESN